LPGTKKYYLAETYEDNLHTASIVRKDNEKILQQQGFVPLQFHHIKDGSAFVKIRRLGELARLAFSVKKGDTVIFHFPMLANAYKILFGLLNKKGVHTVALIIDIDGLRYHDADVLKNELASLALFTHIIAHNAAMKRYLSAYISEDKISSIELFDYPVTGSIPGNSFKGAVCFAGNFEKSGFVNGLYQLNSIQFNLYGPSFKTSDQKNVFYKGSFPSNTLPALLEGSFGLVWDGPSIDNCDEYLQYNNPYKMSLYIAAGLPLIVCKESAVARLVQQYNIGILVNSLYDIERALSNLTEEHYMEMKQNILPVRDKVSQGYFLKTVLDNLAGNLGL
jgi:hypothetical protein